MTQQLGLVSLTWLRSAKLSPEEVHWLVTFVKTTFKCRLGWCVVLKTNQNCIQIGNALQMI